jgi:hypothetical protein
MSLLVTLVSLVLLCIHQDAFTVAALAVAVIYSVFDVSRETEPDSKRLEALETKLTLAVKDIESVKAGVAMSRLR